MADMQEMALAVPSCDFVIVISNVSNLFNSSQKEFFKYLIKGIQEMPKNKLYAITINITNKQRARRPSLHWQTVNDVQSAPSGAV